MTDPIAALDLIGLRPVMVPDLGQDAIILLRSKLILIDSHVDLGPIADRALEVAADLFLAEVAQ